MRKIRGSPLNYTAENTRLTGYTHDYPAITPESINEADPVNNGSYALETTDSDFRAGKQTVTGERTVESRPREALP